MLITKTEAKELAADFQAKLLEDLTAAIPASDPRRDLLTANFRNVIASTGARLDAEIEKLFPPKE